MTGRAIAGAVAAVAGFALMGLELTAVRLLAPHFGDSAYVWTNVIGVILVALAVGAHLGGRLADRGLGYRGLGAVLLAAGAASALAPFLATPLGGWLLPQDLPLDSAFAALVRGSLVATILLFAPAALLLGCTSPVLVRIAAYADGVTPRVGSASALITACSTLGSLAGTFAATHLLVPGIGSRATIGVCAVLLGASGLWLGGMRARTAPLLVVMVLPWLPLGAMRPAPAGATLLAEQESAMQFLQVVRTGAANELTLLKINEGLDSFHSVAVAGSSFTAGRYYDWHAVAPLLAGDGTPPPDLRILSLGSAASTFSRLFHAAYSGCRVDEVELDPAVAALGDAHFGGPGGKGNRYAGIDARVFVERATDRWHVVLVDCYARQIYVPAHVASVEFFRAVQRRLEPGGVVTVNTGGRRDDDPVLRTIGATMAEVFGETLAFRVPLSRNFLLVARQGRPLDPVATLRAVTDTTGELRDVVGQMALPSGWLRIPRGGPVLHDDRPFLDQLQHQQLAPEELGAPPIAITGDAEPEAAAALAAKALQDRDARRALAAVAAARAATAELRRLAGDARWHLTEFAGARAEYEAALALAPGAELATTLRQRLASVAGMMAGPAKAAGVARRNGWLAAVAVVAAALGLWIATRRA